MQITLSKDVFTLVKEIPLEAVMIVQEMYVIMVVILPKTVLSVDVRFSEHTAWFALQSTLGNMNY